MPSIKTFNTEVPNKFQENLNILTGKYKSEVGISDKAWDDNESPDQAANEIKQYIDDVIHNQMLKILQERITYPDEQQRKDFIRSITECSAENREELITKHFQSFTPEQMKQYIEIKKDDLKLPFKVGDKGYDLIDIEMDKARVRYLQKMWGEISQTKPANAEYATEKELDQAIITINNAIDRKDNLKMLFAAAFLAFLITLAFNPPAAIGILVGAAVVVGVAAVYTIEQERSADKVYKKPVLEREIDGVYEARKRNDPENRNKIMIEQVKNFRLGLEKGTAEPRFDKQQKIKFCNFVHAGIKAGIGIDINQDTDAYFTKVWNKGADNSAIMRYLTPNPQYIIEEIKDMCQIEGEFLHNLEKKGRKLMWGVGEHCVTLKLHDVRAALMQNQMNIILDSKLLDNEEGLKFLSQFHEKLSTIKQYKRTQSKEAYNTEMKACIDMMAKFIGKNASKIIAIKSSDEMTNSIIDQITLMEVCADLDNSKISNGEITLQSLNTRLENGRKVKKGSFAAINLATSNNNPVRRSLHDKNSSHHNVNAAAAANEVAAAAANEVAAAAKAEAPKVEKKTTRP